MASPSLFRRLCFVLLPLLCSVVLFAQPTTTRGIGDIEQTDPSASGVRRALIIGVSKYQHIKQLEYADDDAIMVRDYLKTNPAIKLPDNNITLLLDSMATRGRIFTELKKVIDVSKAGDEVIIYFAGHGDVETDIEAGFLLGYDCESSNYPASDAIDISMLERYLDAMAKKQVKVMLIVDACRSGNLAGGKAGAQTTMSSLNDRFNHIAKVLSCKPGELSEEKTFGGGNGHGVFTYYLVNGMSGMADENNDNSVSQDELETYIRDEVKKETAGRQHPRIEGTMKDVKVDKDTKALVAKRMENGSKGTGTAVASRGIGDDFIAKLEPDEKALYDRFKDHIQKDKLNGKGDDHAYGDYLTAKKTGKSYELLNYMSYELQADLEDATQEWLNFYLRGQLEKYTSWKFDSYDDAADKLAIVLSLLDKSDFRYNTIEANKLFFQSIPIFIAKDKRGYDKGLELLLQADKIAPNQPHILSVIGMFYDGQLKPNYTLAEKYFLQTITLSPKWVYTYVGLGGVYYSQKQYDKALKYYKQALELDKNNANALYNLGLAYMYKKDKERDKALEYYRLAIKADSTMYNPYLTIGKDYAEHKDYNTALVYYEKATKLAPHKPAPYNQIGILQAARKEYEKALHAYDLALEEDSLYTDAYYNAASVYAAQKRLDMAEAAYRKVIQIDPSYKEAYAAIAGLKVEAKDYEGAKVWYKKALAADSTYSAVYNDMGIMYRKMKDNKKALDYYNIALKMDSLDADAYNNSANIFSDDKDYDKAIRYYKKAISIDSTSPKYHNNLGISLYNTKRYEEAIVSYGKSLKVDSTNGDAYYNWALVENELKHYDNAINLYKGALKNGVDSADVYYKIGRVYQSMQRKDDAIKMNNKALAINPKHANANLEMGNYYYGRDVYDTALIYYKHNIAYDTTSKEGYYDMGLVYKYGMKDNAKAIENYLHAIGMDKDYVLPYLRIGEIYVGQSEYDKATEAFTKAMKDDKLKAEATGNIAWVYETKEDYPKAIEYYQEALKLDSTKMAYQNKIALQYKAMGKKAKAISEYEKTLKTNPNNVTALQALGSMYMDSMLYDKALEYYSRSIPYDSVTADTWVYTGYLYQMSSKRNLDSAYYFFKGALRIDPDYSWANLNLGYLLNGQGKAAEARPYFERVLKSDSTNYYGTVAIGSTYQTEGDTAKAIKYFKKAIALDSSKSSAYQNLGSLYYGIQLYAQARPYYLRAMALDSTNYDVVMMLGVNYQYEGNGKEAVRLLEKSIAMNPEVTNAYYNLACHYSLENDLPNALKYLEICFKKGYTDFEHMEKDTDMDPIRSQDTYKALLAKYK